MKVTKASIKKLKTQEGLLLAKRGEKTHLDDYAVEDDGDRVQCEDLNEKPQFDERPQFREGSQLLEQAQEQENVTRRRIAGKGSGGIPKKR